MTTLTRLKLAIALAGVVVFAAGVRTDTSRLRLAGIGIVAVAWILRFRKSPRDPDGDSTSAG